MAEKTHSRPLGRPRKTPEPLMEAKARVPRELHASAKVHARERGLTLGDYLAMLMLQDQGLPLPDYIQSQLDRKKARDAEAARRAAQPQLWAAS